MANTVLVTGGCGYIGSHTVLQLLDANYDKKINFVMHFSGYKSVSESSEKPLSYYYNNVFSTITLLEVMKDFNVQHIIFSSSATVYGIPKSFPIDETHSTGNCTNPYGTSKLFSEKILIDCQKANSTLGVTILRYFNPIGAHESGKIGESPNGIPNNLMPYISQTAVGKRDCLYIFGDTYETIDGTGVRDYIHVVDLAKAHVAALDCHSNKLKIYNIGTGKGYSVLQVVNTFQSVCDRIINYKITGKRAGDVAEIYADCSLAYEEIGWKSDYDLEQMCVDTWRWQKNNPNGYDM
ncbi:hypothetical protein A3Q56_00799 [Intoshia linei]|uniref:UDP-glucose 4-epimerase n=1 Tax=Intoshia linei TaxID=1819745 RepID=A0A177BB00_9BILA|nr:hypothetical protein A3Q56_00799 [Intoshia linei]